MRRTRTPSSVGAALGRVDALDDAAPPLRRAFHEIRSSVVAVKAVLGMVRERVESNDAVERSRALHELDLISRSTERVDATLLRAQPLLQTAPQRMLVDARALLEGVAATMAHAIPGGVALELRVPPDLPPLATDGDQLWALVREVLGHAFDCSPERGRVTASARAHGSGIRISVEYGPLRRRDQTSLALSIAGVIARRLGATIAVDAAAGDTEEALIHVPLSRRRLRGTRHRRGGRR
jgi:hypothetical protein